MFYGTSFLLPPLSYLPRLALGTTRNPFLARTVLLQVFSVAVFFNRAECTCASLGCDVHSRTVLLFFFVHTSEKGHRRLPSLFPSRCFHLRIASYDEHSRSVFRTRKGTHREKAHTPFLPCMQREDTHACP
jgi:hypothetical protein